MVASHPVDALVLPEPLNGKFSAIEFATLEEFKTRSSMLAEMAASLDNEYLGKIPWPKEDPPNPDV